jgi:hypothetical protein
VRLHVIWCHSPQSLSEASWIRWLLGDFELVEHVAPKLDLFEDNSIYVVSSNELPLSQMPAVFLDGIGRIRGKGLFHISDEWYSGGYEIYSRFDFVLRNYYSKLFVNPGIKVVPLGPANDLMDAPAARSAADRKLIWSFAGGKTAARIQMFNQLKKIEPHRCLLYDGRRREKPPLDRDSFLTLLSETYVSPCPMGNVVLETFRLYESLEMGCIPIAERRRWMPYFDRLMPGHPIPTFLSWRNAGRFVQMLSKNQFQLGQCQRTIAEWWQQYKINLRNDVTSFVSKGMKGAFHGALAEDWRYRRGMRHQMWRLFELVRHGNVASLKERGGITLGRMIRRASHG